MTRPLLILFTLTLSFSAFSQTKMFINKTNGTSDSLNISDIKSITFKTYSSSITNGLVAYYPFNGDATDASGNGNNGTPSNCTPTTDRFGISNRAFSFNGTSSSIVCANGQSLQISADITVCAWIKTSTLPSSSKVVISKYDASDKGWLIDTPNNSTGTVMFDGRDSTHTYRSSTGATRIDDNKWHLVVGQRQGTTWAIFVDTALSAQSNVNNGSSIQNSAPLTIGAQSSGAGSTWWNGLIDDVRIYNRALSIDEIKALYHENGW